MKRKTAKISWKAKDEIFGRSMIRAYWESRHWRHDLGDLRMVLSENDYRAYLGILNKDPSERISSQVMFQGIQVVCISDGRPKVFLEI